MENLGRTVYDSYHRNAVLLTTSNSWCYNVSPLSYTLGYKQLITGIMCSYKGLKIIVLE